MTCIKSEFATIYRITQHPGIKLAMWR
jgi:hypothetical protein